LGRFRSNPHVLMAEDYNNFTQVNPV